MLQILEPSCTENENGSKSKPRPRSKIGPKLYITRPYTIRIVTLCSSKERKHNIFI